jgi:hypothetical protein
MKEYKIIEANTLSLLQEFVNDHLRNGWEPVGGVSVGGGKFLQAIYK